jgi:RNA methyltransferase, TrmH family
LRLSSQLYRDLTLAAQPQGIGAVLQRQHASLADLRPTDDSLWLAVESIDSPGNFGTILRTAEAAGVTGTFLLGRADDPWHPAAVRASMGSLFSQKLVQCSPQEFTAWARSMGVVTVASSPGGLLDYRALRIPRPAALVMGNERCGLPEYLMDAANFTARIPMSGRCDSINVAIAAGILLFEMCRRTG